MAQNTIICPKCNFEFEINEAFEKKLSEKIKKQYEDEYILKVKELEKKKKDIDEEVGKKVSLKEKELRETLRKDFDAQNKIKLGRLETELRLQKESEENYRIEISQLLKDKMKAEQQRDNAEINAQRRLDEQKAEIAKSMMEKFQEEHRFSLMQKDQQIESMKREVENMQRKLQQGSQQVQGEVGEMDIEKVLGTKYPSDIIDPVPKGAPGADSIQTVINENGQQCGKIIWESKDRKNWSDKWLDKLKDDQRTVSAEIAVIVTTTLPKYVKDFELHKGVWITSFRYFIPLSSALRGQLIEIKFAKSATSNIEGKVKAIYDYLSSPQFRQKINAIVEAFNKMQEQLNKEKRVMNSQWKERETLIARVVSSTTGMYGEMKGIIGAQMPTVKELEFDESRLLEENTTAVENDEVPF